MNTGSRASVPQLSPHPDSQETFTSCSSITELYQITSPAIMSFLSSDFKELELFVVLGVKIMVLNASPHLFLTTWQGEVCSPQFVLNWGCKTSSG